MLIIGTLIAMASMAAFVVAAVAVFQPMPKLKMPTPKAAAIGMLLSVASCAAGSMLIQTDRSVSETRSQPSTHVAQAQNEAATPPQPPKVGPLQDSATGDPPTLDPDPGHPPTDAVRHIEQTLDLWDALDRCRRDPAFQFYGLGAGGPCGNFAEVAENLRQSAMEKVVYQIGLQCSAGDVSTAAVSYLGLTSRRDPEQLKYLAWVRGHMEECRRKLPSLEPKIEVSRGEMGGPGRSRSRVGPWAAIIGIASGFSRRARRCATLSMARPRPSSRTSSQSGREIHNTRTPRTASLCAS